MNKFKFGDKVQHSEHGIGVVLNVREAICNSYLYNVAWDSLDGANAWGLIEEFELTPASEWIACSERMPEPCVTVIATDGESVGVNWVGVFENDDGDELLLWDDFSMGQDVTHWMPLPELPQE